MERSMWFSFRWTALGIVFVLVLPAYSVADEPRKANHAKLVIEEFDVASDGDVLVVPVYLAGKRLAFVVDTGFSAVIVDKTLEGLLGERRRSTRARTNNGFVTLDIFAPPSLRLGNLIAVNVTEV